MVLGQDWSLTNPTLTSSHHLLSCFKTCTRPIVDHHRRSLSSSLSARSFHTIYRHFQVLRRLKCYSQSAAPPLHDYRCLGSVYSRPNTPFKSSKKPASWRYSAYRCRKQKQGSAFFGLSCSSYGALRRGPASLERTLGATQPEVWRRKRIYKEGSSPNSFSALDTSLVEPLSSDWLAKLLYKDLPTTLTSNTEIYKSRGNGSAA